jgi:hypothetical protein
LTRRSRIEHLVSLVAFCGVLAFVTVVLVEHAIDRSFDPTTHEISEYAHGRTGALMTAGFTAWAVSLAATAGVVVLALRSPLLAVALAVASAGMLLTAGFATQTSAGRLPAGRHLSSAGRLHDIGSGASTVALLVAAVASVGAVADPVFRRRVVALIGVAVCASVVLLAVGPEVAGVRQRVLVAVACVWQVLLLAWAGRRGAGAS